MTGQGALSMQRTDLISLTISVSPMALKNSSHACTVVGSCSAKVYTTTRGSAKQDQLCLEKFDQAACATGVPVQDSKWMDGACVYVCVRVHVCVCVCVCVCFIRHCQEQLTTSGRHMMRQRCVRKLICCWLLTQSFEIYNVHLNTDQLVSLKI